MRTRTPLRVIFCIVATVAMTTAGFANTWTQKATYPSDASGSTGFTVGNKAYVYTGVTENIGYSNHGTVVNVFWEYDQATDSWTQKATFPGAVRRHAVGFSIGSKGYMGTGDTNVGSSTLLKDFWEYDPITNTWTPKADFGGTERADAVGFSIGNKGYLGTGTTAYQFLLQCMEQAANDFWEYDPMLDTWTQKAPVGGGLRTRAACFSVGNKGYIGTGTPGDGCAFPFSAEVKDFWEYDPAYNIWTVKAEFPGDIREGAVGFSLGSSGYMGGGINDEAIQLSGLSDLWRYTPSSNTWIQQADFIFAEPWLGFAIGSKGYSLRGNALHEYDPNTTNSWSQKADVGGSGRSAAVGFSIGTKGYITTGNDGFVIDHFLSDLWEYNQATGAWNQKADLPGPARNWATGFAIGNKGYVGTGCDVGLTNHVLKDFWEYDPAHNSWTQKADLPGAARQKAAGFAVGGKGYIGTGLSTTDLVDFWEYDPASDTWTQRPALPNVGRRYAVGLSIGSKGYIGAGSSFSGVLETDLDHTASFGDFWEYDPATLTWASRAAVGAIHEKGVGFSIGPIGYVGTGGYGFLAHDDLKAYDPTTDTWTVRSVYNGGPRGAAVGFAIGTKGYIGTGYDDIGTRRTDFWEYDSGLLCLPGTPCDDGDACSSGDVFNANCACVGTPSPDSDGDGICDATDPCDNTTDGQVCDDGDPFTDNDVRNNCVCAGTPTVGYWTPEADFGGLARNGAVSFTLGSYAYLGTGYDGTFHNDFWKYDPASNTWGQVAALPGVGRAYAAAFTSGAKGYVGTGRFSNSTVYDDDLADFWAYDPAANTWSSIASFPTKLFASVSFSVAGSGYVGMGTVGANTGGEQTSFYMYDASQDAWLNKASYTSLQGPGLLYGSAFSAGGKGYVAMGSGGTGYKNDLWQYDPVGNSWVQKSSCPGDPRAAASAFSIGNSGFITGGFHGATLFNDLWEYNTLSDTWAARPAPGPSGRFGAVGFDIGEKGYLATGSLSSGTYTVDLRSYTPIIADCLGIRGGTALPGTACDDGLATTSDDAYTPACVCEGLPNSIAWRPRTDLSGPGRIEAVAFAINGKGYMGTGYNGAPLGDFFEFDPTTNAWSQKADFGGGPRTRATGFSIGSKGYIGTGLTGVNTNHDDLWEYDPAQNTWTSKAAFPGGIRQMATGFSIGAKGYIGFGTVFTTYPTDFYSYDPTTDSWTQIAGASYFGLGRIGTTAFTANGIAYVGGGAYSGSLIDQFHAYDPSTDTWSSVASFPPGGRVGMVSFSIGGKGYAGAGGGANGIVADMWQYDPASDTWVQKEDVPGSPRWSAFSFGIGEKGYVGSGSPDYATYLTDFYEYRDYDCLGVAAGSTHPGTACDDGDENTTNDVYNMDCVCVGLPADCFGVPGGPAQPGTACDDGLANTINDVYGTDCVCAGTPQTTGLWTQRTDFSGFAREAAVAFSIGAKGYVATGMNETTTFRDLWEYDPATDSWAQMADVGGTVRQGAVGFCVGDKGFIGTGLDDNAIKQSDFWEFDPLFNNWLQVSSFPGGGRYRAVGVGTSTLGYVGTGQDDNGFTNDLWAYDPVQDAWTAQADLPGDPRALAIGFAIDQFVYVGLGALNGTVLQDLWRFDPLSLPGSWSQMSDLAGHGLGSAVEFVVDGKAFVGTGQEQYTGWTQGFWAYDPSVDTWTAIADLTGPARTGSVAFALDGHGYVATGSSANGDLGDLWEYTPSSTGCIAGSACDDGNQCTINDVLDATCYCVGSYYDSDGDGWCDPMDNCPWATGRLFDHCDDGNPSTVDDRIIGDCVCSGVLHPGTWTQRASNPGIARSQAIGFAIGDVGYYGTGEIGTFQYASDLWSYDPVADSWQQKADLPGDGRNNASAFVIAGKGYVFGGLSAQVGYLNDLLEYDAVSNTWAVRASLPAIGRGFTFAFAIGGNGYIGTGTYPGVAALNDFWQYDPVADSWVQRANFPGSIRYGAVAFATGGIGYAGFGGVWPSGGSLTTFSDLYAYDPATDAWTQKANLPSAPRTITVGFAIGAKGYVGTGGNNDIGGTPDFWEYDPAIDSWERKLTPPGPYHSFATGFGTSTKGYLIGGVNPYFQPISDTWEFDPASQCLVGSSCDDNNACTINDVLDASCACIGTLQDADGDGTCDALDACPNDPNKIAPGNCGCGNPEPGASCDDNNPSTTGDVVDANCTCAGTLVVNDCLGVPSGPALPGTACDDGNACTTGDVYDANCVCVGGAPLNCDDGDPCTLDQCNPGSGCTHTAIADSDGDGSCDAVDGCPNDPNKIAPGNCGCGNDEPGATCDDGNALTINDVVGANCTCAGTLLVNDCLGVPGGTALPGTSCDDGSACTTGDVFDANCICTGTPVNVDDGNACTFDSCDPINGVSHVALNCDDSDPCTLDQCNPMTGCVHTPAPDSDGDGTCDAIDLCPNDPNKIAPGTCGCGNPEIGQSCDDGDPNTIGDTVNGSCQCVGSPIGGCTGNEVIVAIYTDNVPEDLTWVITNSSNVTIASGGPNAVQEGVLVLTTACLGASPVSDCYGFKLVDGSGNGITGGYWQLRSLSGKVLLGDAFPSGSNSPSLTPALASYTAHSFCLPPGNCHIASTSCGRFDYKMVNKVLCNNVPGATSYQFEFSDPDAGFIRRIAVPVNSVAFNQMVTSPLTPGVHYFARVRSNAAGAMADAHFGGGCEVGMSIPAMVPCTQLISYPNYGHACNESRAFNTNNSFIYATPVVGATEYQFRIYIPSEGYDHTFIRSSYILQLKWNTSVAPPLVNGSTYSVQVNVKVGTQYSGFCGDVCTITIDNSGNRPEASMVQANETATMWPNPVRESQVNLSIDGIQDAEQHITVDIQDIYGKQVFAKAFGNSGERFSTILDLPGDIASGVYMVNITVNGQRTVQRLSIMK